jgi:hypothetical protein
MGWRVGGEARDSPATELGEEWWRGRANDKGVLFQGVPQAAVCVGGDGLRLGGLRTWFCMGP